jgi:hypothetical protein
MSVTVCDAALLSTSVEGWMVGPNFLPLNFNTPFSSCLTKGWVSDRAREIDSGPDPKISDMMNLS